jgi:hypothetical protein
MTTEQIRVNPHDPRYPRAITSDEQFWCYQCQRRKISLNEKSQLLTRN